MRGLVPSLIKGLRVVQGLRVVPVFLYRYSMKISLKKAPSPGTTRGADQTTRHSRISQKNEHTIFSSGNQNAKSDFETEKHYLFFSQLQFCK